MNTKHYTSVLQSKKLLELGLNPESADMIYTMVNGRCTPFIRIETIDEIEEDDVPCWSVGALIELMPKVEGYYPTMLRFNNFKLTYVDKRNYCIHLETGELLEAAFNMVVYLLENGFIKQESKTSSK